MSEGKFKHDDAAVKLWGENYAKIPKSVFAAVAWHLADAASDLGMGNGQAEQRFAQEVAILRDNGILPIIQANRVINSLD